MYPLRSLNVPLGYMYPSLGTPVIDYEEKKQFYIISSGQVNSSWLLIQTSTGNSLIALLG